jgi:ATP/maltotriose-dependent transcriptional regulator MalT
LQLTATTYGHLSSQVYFIQGDFDKTRATAEEAIKIASSLSYSNATGLALITLGLVASVEERYEEGKNLCEKGASTKVQPYVSEMAVWGLSVAACGLGDYAAAGEFLSGALNYLFNLRGLTGIIASLPIAAILLTHKGNPEHAVELLALAFTHPVRASGWIEKWPLLGRLRSRLEQELGYETYAAAWEHGTLLDLDAVAAELVQQFQRNPVLSKGKETLSPITTLSERELEVLRLVAEGCSNQEIADRLYVGVSTVKKHINHIYDKLDAKNRTQAVARARDLHLLI